MQLNLRRAWIMVPGLALCLALGAIACASEPVPAPTAEPQAAMMEEPKVDVDALKVEVVAHYAKGVHGLYAQSLASAKVMDTAIDAFIADPNPASLEAAKRAWLRARDDYGPTEVFRFYGGPIDNEENGPEGLINAWPMDESYIDYVEGNPTAGIINMPAEYPTIDAELIISLNEEGGEQNVSTGWHAIEFLLWGQDLNDGGPGDRPVEDFTTNDNADRRAQYLAVASDTLIGHLQDMVDNGHPAATTTGPSSWPSRPMTPWSTSSPALAPSARANWPVSGCLWRTPSDPRKTSIPASPTTRSPTSWATPSACAWC